MDIIRLMLALITRKSCWHKEDIPTTPGVFSREPYCRYTLECRDNFYGIRVIDLIDVLMRCDLHDVVTVNDCFTGIESVEQCGGIPLMDICDEVRLVAERVGHDDVRQNAEQNVQKANIGVDHDMKLFSESVDMKAADICYEWSTTIGATLILAGTVGSIIMATHGAGIASLVVIISSIISAALVDITMPLMCAKLNSYATDVYEYLKNSPNHDIDGHK